MGVWNFVREAGERIAANARAAASFNPGGRKESSAPSRGASSQQEGGSAGDAIEDYIRAQNLAVENLQVRFDAPASTVHVSGLAKDQATKEKVILCCGNLQGVEKVDDNIDVREKAPPSQHHTVAKGDTLSAIAKKVYGDANKYQVIFEANQPMLKHPDKIYPGQVLRIPPLS